MNSKKKFDVFNNEGTVFGSINKNNINAFTIPLISEEKINEFESIISPMDALIRNNTTEISALMNLRGYLLDKLCSTEKMI